MYIYVQINYRLIIVLILFIYSSVIHLLSFWVIPYKLLLEMRTENKYKLFETIYNPFTKDSQISLRTSAFIDIVSAAP